MYEIKMQNNNARYGLTEFVADTRAEVSTLPTKVAPGSTCIVIEDSSVWMLSPGEDKAWHEL